MLTFSDQPMFLSGAVRCLCLVLVVQSGNTFANKSLVLMRWLMPSG